MLTVSSVRGDLREKTLPTCLKQKVSPYDFKDCAASQSLRAQGLFTTTCRGGCSAALPENLRIHPERSACTGATAETTASQLLHVFLKEQNDTGAPSCLIEKTQTRSISYSKGPDTNTTGSCGDHVGHIL